MRSLALKRTFDMIVAAVALVMLAPLMLVAAVFIRLSMGRPILFHQLRPGWHERPFTLLKFRTMIETRDAAGNLLPDEDRMTAFGTFLRRLSLDELPQLWNVLKGDLSLVGPRPLLMEYLPRYSQFERRRHEVKPGITGWAQAQGRNALTWEQKFALDVWYVDNWNIWLDLKILALTAKAVCRGEGIRHPGHATMAKFVGSH